ncbi:MAG TPA: MazG-like family protein [Actinocrinis sp.]|nr:MazG-like family protein [Actinocrinis sp.]HZU54659.1 MazG-like family protein [Actinocrinis sp.]
MDDRAWETTARLVDWLDGHHRDNDLAPEVIRLLRVLKLSEEVGETTQAVIGALGANPRKGTTHKWSDVEHELCDVIITAMVALTTLNPDARMVFTERLEHVATRSLG